MSPKVKLGMILFYSIPTKKPNIHLSTRRLADMKSSSENKRNINRREFVRLSTIATAVALQRLIVGKP